MSAECRRCGECCRNRGPVLHSADRGLFVRGVLALADLVRVRKDEPAFDPVRGRPVRAPAGMLKVGGSGGSWTCRFFAPRPPACRIHADRPLECRLLFCGDPSALAAAAGRDLMDLDGLPGIDPSLADLAREFDRAFPFSMFNSLLDEAGRDPGALAGACDLINRELRFRARTCAARRLTPAEETAVLGRPFFFSAAARGFEVREGEGGVSLRPPAVPFS